MSIIKDIIAREVLDSRGNPTVEVDLFLETGHRGRMMVPSGASTGKFEAHELRDGEQRFRGKGVKKAVANVNGVIKNILAGEDASNQERLDKLMIECDGTPNKSNLGANAILGVSFAAAHATASFKDKPLFQYLAEKYLPVSEKIMLPLPMVNIISGGLHAGKNIDIQDILVIPISPGTYEEAIEMISTVYYATKEVLKSKGHISRLIADEGGFGPELTSNEEALDVMSEVFHFCGYKPNADIAIALDVASSHFYDAEKKLYHLASEKRALNSSEMIGMLERWTKRYPIVSIEDGLAEEDWDGWVEMTNRIGNKIQIIGDDLFTTHPKRIQKGIELKAANAVLVKMNQIGTLTETVESITLARKAGFKTVISARSGETEDSTLADLATGLNGGQIKIGSLARSSRLAKYNQLLRISEQIDRRYIGKLALQ